MTITAPVGYPAGRSTNASWIRPWSACSERPLQATSAAS